MKKQLLLMITAISMSLTLSAQGIVEPNISEQIYDVGTTATNIQLVKDTDYTKSGAGPTGTNYEQFNATIAGVDSNIVLKLQSTADLNASLVFEFRQWAGNESNVSITVDGNTTDILLNPSSEYLTSSNGTLDFFLITLPGTLSFTSGVTEEITFALGDGNGGTNSLYRRRFYNVRLTNPDVVLSTNDFIAKKDIKVYPNPTTDRFKLNSKINVNNVKIFNLSGQLVKTLESATNNYDISDLKSGLYLANINTDSGSRTIKLIKE
ncbi:T9SS type A sorting domain-containing protein [Formosa sp. PL04]|uniref:T9SS type A sorting domain-containing protein n=1 Tax=Formosa sp. PL04 TaxID=3081755 RepID=UPI002982185C|nr:T9SS type A sorting domain-containing protein [Formosa sp. PL04]MDW5290123.1 T9SS type A sorting domain-containing protein [Formosa sp. PL04]